MVKEVNSDHAIESLSGMPVSIRGVGGLIPFDILVLRRYYARHARAVINIYRPVCTRK